MFLLGVLGQYVDFQEVGDSMYLVEDVERQVDVDNGCLEGVVVEVYFYSIVEVRAGFEGRYDLQLWGERGCQDWVGLVFVVYFCCFCWGVTKFVFSFLFWWIARVSCCLVGIFSISGGVWYLLRSLRNVVK